MSEHGICDKLEARKTATEQKSETRGGNLVGFGCCPAEIIARLLSFRGFVSSCKLAARSFKLCSAANCRTTLTKAMHIFLGFWDSKLVAQTRLPSASFQKKPGLMLMRMITTNVEALNRWKVGHYAGPFVIASTQHTDLEITKKGWRSFK